MSRFTNPAKLQLPKSWSTCVRSAVLHVVSLARYAAVYTRSWAADSPNARVRLKAAKDHVEQDAALLREEIRIKDARMASIAPQRRPSVRSSFDCQRTCSRRVLPWRIVASENVHPPLLHLEELPRKTRWTNTGPEGESRESGRQVELH